MQQWECHIEGLENVFGAREVEKIGRQIDGVEKLSVDFAGEMLLLRADSVAVLKQLEKVLALSGYKLLKKGYYVTSVILIPELISAEAQELVKTLIGSHTQVSKLDVRPRSKRVYLTHDIDFPVSLFICDLNNQQISAHLQSQYFAKSRWRGMTSIAVLFAALFFLAGVSIENYYHSSLGTLTCFILSISITVVLLTRRAFKQITLHRKLTYSSLMLLVTLISVIHNLWFEASLLGLSLAVSFMFEEHSSWKLKQQWSQLRSMLPVFGFKKRGARRVATPVENIAVNDILLINVGEYVPVDGEIVRGHGTFGVKNIVAGAETLTLQPQDKIFAGLQLIQGEVEFKAISSAKNSILYLLLKRLEDVQSKVTPKQKKLAKKLDYLLYGFLCVSVILLIMLFTPSFMFTLPMPWLEKTLALMVISGSAFILTSVQFSHLFSYLYAAKNGLYFFSPSIWHHLVDAKTLAVGKVGVITNDQPEVQEVISLTRYTTHEIFSMAASLAVVSEDKRFRALVKRAQTNNITLIRNLEVSVRTSKFIRAKLNGKMFTLGMQSTIEEMKLMNPEIENKLKLWETEGENIFLLVDENNVLGLITVLDPIRNEVGEFIDFCHYLGFDKISLLSRDNKGASQVIANRFGFDEVFSDLSAKEENQRLMNLSQQNAVISIVNNPDFSSDENITVLNNAFFVTVPEMKNQIISLGKNLMSVPLLCQLAQKLNTRMRGLVRLIVNVKLVVLIGVFTGFISFDQVIIVEFLLATWVLSSTYKPKNMFAEV